MPEQSFFNCTAHMNPLGLIKTQTLIREVWGRASHAAFLTSFQGAEAAGSRAYTLSSKDISPKAFQF